MTRVAGIMQPTYLPWIGYFELMDQSDVFVYLDDVQFNKKSWQQRNRIKGPNGEVMLTIPVSTSGKGNQRICDVEIEARHEWREKHFKTIDLAYRKAPFHSQYIDRFRALYEQEWPRLVDFTLALADAVRELLGIATRCVRSSSFAIAAEGNERVVEICRRVECPRLYDTAGARVFIDDDVMRAGAVEVVFQQYEHPRYRQLHGEFLPYMAAIDLLFNEGPRSLEILRSGRRQLLHP